MAGTAHDKGADAAEGFLHSLHGHVTHKIGHGCLDLTDGGSSAFQLTAAVLVHQTVVLTVVVPHGAGSHLQNRLFQHLFPHSPCSRAGEIHKRSGAAPPGSHSRFILLTVFYENAFFFHLFQPGMDKEDSRFYIGRNRDATFFHFREKHFGIPEPLFVPGKDTSF